jgi:hypothetical protein
MPKSTKTSVKAVEAVEDHIDETATPTENDDVDQYIDAKDFDIKKFFVKPIEEKMGTKSQYMAFPKLKTKKSKDGESVIIVTEPIKLTKGGIPKIDGEYKKSDKDREFFWLGEDKTQQSCIDLFNGLRQIDETFSELIADNANTKTIHHAKDGKKEPLDKLEYVSLVRESGQQDNKDAEKQYEAYDRIKVRFNTKYDADKAEGEPSEITTHLFLLDKEEAEPYTSVTDFEKSLRWNCEARFVLMINKFWAMKALKNKKRECGFTIKCLQVYITKVSTSGTGVSQVDKFRKRLFAPSATLSSAPVHEEKPKATSKVTKKVETESESEDSDSDDEKPQAKPATKVASNKAKAKSESESSEESSEESDSEDSPVPQKGKAPVKATKGKKVESSSEESDSEDEKSAPKAKARK